MSCLGWQAWPRDRIVADPEVQPSLLGPGSASSHKSSSCISLDRWLGTPSIELGLVGVVSNMSNQLDLTDDTDQLLPFQADLLDQLVPEHASRWTASSPAQPTTPSSAQLEVNALLILARGLGMRAIIANLVRASSPSRAASPDWADVDGGGGWSRRGVAQAIRSKERQGPGGADCQRE